jgi:hypothetical protein
VDWIGVQRANDGFGKSIDKDRTNIGARRSLAAASAWRQNFIDSTRRYFGSGDNSELSNVILPLTGTIVVLHIFCKSEAYEETPLPRACLFVENSPQAR